MTLLTDIKDLIIEEKAWWLIPIVVVLFFTGLLVVFSKSSALSPFIYALF